MALAAVLALANAPLSSGQSTGLPHGSAQPDPAEATNDLAALGASSEPGPLGSVVTPGIVALTGSANLLPAASLADLAGSMPSQIVGSTGMLAGDELGYGTDIEPAPDAIVPEVLSREPIEDARTHGPAELWRVTSPAMKRVIQLEVYPAQTGKPAPVLYLLDGVYSAQPSDFLLKDAGIADARAAGFTVVVPTGANGSQYADWIAEDPVLGPNKWQTFLSRELPPLVEDDPAMPFNGKRGIAGISMGAGGALRIAAANPGMYQAAAGVSGCYGTLDDNGYESLRVTVESRGGIFANMWGERGSELFRENDLLGDPRRLEGTHVFISSASGAIGPVEVREFGAEPEVLVVGYTLESQTSMCTDQMAAALDEADMDATVHRMPQGIHNWTTFGPSLTAAVEDMTPHLL